MTEGSQNRLKNQEVTGGRDYYSPEDFEAVSKHYQKAFEVLSSMDINPKKIFIGACGFGADVLAAHQVWPEAEITAVSILDIPGPEVVEQLGDKLHFQERTILDYLEQANTDFALRGFDLVVFFNVTSEIQDWDFHRLLFKIIGEEGYIFHHLGAGISMKLWMMNETYDQVTLPQEWQEREYWLWQSGV